MVVDSEGYDKDRLWFVTRLGFTHPDGRPLTFEAPLPEDLRSLIARLRTQG